MDCDLKEYGSFFFFFFLIIFTHKYVENCNNTQVNIVLEGVFLVGLKLLKNLYFLPFDLHQKLPILYIFKKFNVNFIRFNDKKIELIDKNVLNS